MVTVTPSFLRRLYVSLFSSSGCRLPRLVDTYGLPTVLRFLRHFAIATPIAIIVAVAPVLIYCCRRTLLRHVFFTPVWRLFTPDMPPLFCYRA